MVWVLGVASVAHTGPSHICTPQVGKTDIHAVTLQLVSGKKVKADDFGQCAKLVCALASSLRTQTTAPQKSTHIHHRRPSLAPQLRCHYCPSHFRIKQP